MNTLTSIKYIILTILFVVASVNFTRTTLEIVKSSQRLDDIKEEVNKLEAEKSGLEKEIEYKKTDAYVEDKARDDLNMLKPGEKLFVVIQKGITNQKSADVLSSTSQKESTEEAEKKESKLYLWYRLFF